MIGLSANIQEIKFPAEDVVTQKTHTQFSASPQIISIIENKENCLTQWTCLTYNCAPQWHTRRWLGGERVSFFFFSPLTSVFIPECASSSQQPRENKEKGSVVAVNRETQREKTMRQIADCISRAKGGGSPFLFLSVAIMQWGVAFARRTFTCWSDVCEDMGVIIIHVSNVRHIVKQENQCFSCCCFVFPSVLLLFACMFLLISHG